MSNSKTREVSVKLIYKDDEIVGCMMPAKGGGVNFYTLKEISYAKIDDLFDPLEVTNTK